MISLSICSQHHEAIEFKYAFLKRMSANLTKPCSKIPSFSSLFFLLTSGLATTMANDKRHVKHSGCLPRYERVAKKKKVFAHSYENDTKRIFRL